jgi:phage host-nuclease inhibitor protein Gam
MNQLQRIEIEEVTPEVKESFRVTDTDSLNWAFRKLQAYQQELAEVNRLANSEMERIKTWQEREQKRISEHTEFFESLISQFATEKRAQDPKFKCSTPYGKISFRKQQPKWEYDEKTLIESLKSNGFTDLIRIKEEPDKAELKKRFAVNNGQVVCVETGVLIEGVMVYEQPEKISITITD